MLHVCMKAAEVNAGSVDSHESQDQLGHHEQMKLLFNNAHITRTARPFCPTTTALILLYNVSSESGGLYTLPIRRWAPRNTSGSRPRLRVITFSTRRLSSLQRRKKDVWISWKPDRAADEGHF